MYTELAKVKQKMFLLPKLTLPIPLSIVQSMRTFHKTLHVFYQQPTKLINENVSFGEFLKTLLYILSEKIKTEEGLLIIYVLRICPL